MLTNNTEDNYLHFFSEAIAMGCVWSLEGEEGFAQSASVKYKETTVIPFWSQPEYAQVHRQDEWQDYEVVAIDLGEFLDDWLPGMHEDVILVGINWDEELEGEDHEPLDVLEEFEKIIDQK